MPVLGAITSPTMWPEVEAVSTAVAAVAAISAGVIAFCALSKQNQQLKDQQALNTSQTALLEHPTKALEA